MYPGLDELTYGDHFQDLVKRGLHEQYVRSVAPTTTPTRRWRLVALLERVGARLQNELARPETGAIPSEKMEPLASGSSPEPIPWLPPYRIP